MLPRLSLLTLAALLAAPACIIDATDDDDNGDSANDTGTPTTSATNATAATNATNATGSGSAEGSGDDTTAADTTAGGGACGWGQTGDDMVPEGYICGGDGADPSETYPMDCPADVTLAVGGECGSIQGPGCCDAEGNAWFCGDDGNGPVLAQITC